jgi:hypothetical protein
MADIKEVRVTLTESDAKKLARTTTRKRKQKGGDDTNDIENFRLNKLDGNNPNSVSTPPTFLPISTAPVVNTAPAPAPPAVNTAPAPAPPAVNAAPAPAPPAVNAAPAPAPTTNTSVKILQEKKTPNALNTPQPPLNGGSAKIIPTKKHLTRAPMATTFKKPALVVGNIHPKKSTEITHGGVKKTRRFVERKIAVPIRSATATRKQTVSLKEKINTMPIASVRKMLLRKGLMKLKSNPPDSMARSLLLEYMLLHRAE